MEWLGHVTGHQTTDWLTVRERDWQKERVRERKIPGQRWVQRGSGQVQIDEVTARQRHGVKAHRDALVSHSASHCGDEHRQWHTIKVKEHLLVMSHFYMVSLPSLVFFSIPPWLFFFSSHSVVWQSHLKSFLICAVVFAGSYSNYLHNNLFQNDNEWNDNKIFIKKENNFVSNKTIEVLHPFPLSSLSLSAAKEQIICYHVQIYLYCIIH